MAAILTKKLRDRLARKDLLPVNNVCSCPAYYGTSEGGGFSVIIPGEGFLNSVPGLSNIAAFGDAAIFPIGHNPAGRIARVYNTDGLNPGFRMYGEPVGYQNTAGSIVFVGALELGLFGFFEFSLFDVFTGEVPAYDADLSLYTPAVSLKPVTVVSRDIYDYSTYTRLFYDSSTNVLRIPEGGGIASGANSSQSGDATWIKMSSYSREMQQDGTFSLEEYAIIIPLSGNPAISLLGGTGLESGVYCQLATFEVTF